MKKETWYLIGGIVILVGAGIFVWKGINKKPAQRKPEQKQPEAPVVPDARLADNSSMKDLVKTGTGAAMMDLDQMINAAD